MDMEVRLDEQDRIVIPAKLRKAFNLRPGDRLIARAEGKKIVLESREDLLARVKHRFAVIPPEVDLVEELIAQRRAEAQRAE